MSFLKNFSKNQIKFLKTIAQIAIFAVVGYYVYNILTDNWAKLAEYKIEINYFWIALAILVFALHSYLNGYNWYYMIFHSKWEGNGKSHLSLTGQMDVYLKSYTLRYIPGNVVGILSRAIFNKEYKIPMIMSLWGWFWENITYLVISIIIGILVLPYVDATPFFSWFVVLPAAALGVFVILANDWIKIPFNKFLVPKLPQKAREEFVSLDLPLIKRINLMLGYTGSWILYSASFIFLVHGLGIELHPLLIPINALSYAVGYLSLVTPSGGGVREFVMGFLLANALGYDAVLVLVIPVAARIVFIIGELLAFGVFKVFQLIYTTYKLQKIQNAN